MYNVLFRDVPLPPSDPLDRSGFKLMLFLTVLILGVPSAYLGGTELAVLVHASPNQTDVLVGAALTLTAAIVVGIALELRMFLWMSVFFHLLLIPLALHLIAECLRPHSYESQRHGGAGDDWIDHYDMVQTFVCFLAVVMTLGAVSIISMSVCFLRWLTHEKQTAETRAT